MCDETSWYEFSKLNSTPTDRVHNIRDRTIWLELSDSKCTNSIHILYIQAHIDSEIDSIHINYLPIDLDTYSSRILYNTMDWTEWSNIS